MADLTTLLAIFGCVFLILLVIRWILLSLKIDNLHQKAVVITGCDHGFGYLLALKCAEMGMQVFATCQTEKGRKNLIQNSTHLAGTVQAYIVDITSQRQVDEFVENVENSTGCYGGLHAVVNNAGIVGYSCYDDFLSVLDYETTCKVNLFGTIRVTHAFKELVKKTNGRMILMSSVCGRFAIPGVGPYTVSKFAIRGYADVLRRELKMWNVSVHLMEPGFHQTPLINKENVATALDHVWKRAPSKAKQDYGEEFFVEISAKSNMLLNAIATKNLTGPVNAYVHAITAKYPKIRYSVGLDAVQWFVPLSILPSFVGDAMVSLCDKLARIPTPKALMATK